MAREKRYFAEKAAATKAKSDRINAQVKERLCEFEICLDALKRGAWYRSEAYARLVPPSKHRFHVIRVLLKPREAHLERLVVTQQITTHLMIDMGLRLDSFELVHHKSNTAPHIDVKFTKMSMKRSAEGAAAAASADAKRQREGEEEGDERVG